MKEENCVNLYKVSFVCYTDGKGTYLFGDPLVKTYVVLTI